MNQINNIPLIVEYKQPILKGKFEYMLYDSIKNGCLKWFYLEDFISKKNSKTSKERELIFFARRELIKQGQIISVLSKDVTGWLIETPTDLRPNKLIQLTYQGIKKPLEEKYSHKKFVGWEDVWKDTFNEWVREYSQKIIYNL